MIHQSSSSLQRAALTWIAAGALIGGLSSAALKLSDIVKEPAVEYKNKTLEMPIRFTFHASRMAVHAGFGAALGGFTAATAPVSIPFYIWWRSDVDKDSQSTSSRHK